MGGGSATFNLSFDDLADDDVLRSFAASVDLQENIDEVIQESNELLMENKISNNIFDFGNCGQHHEPLRSFTDVAFDVNTISDNCSISSSDSLQKENMTTFSLENCMKNLNACMEMTARSRDLIHNSLAGRPVITKKATPAHAKFIKTGTKTLRRGPRAMGNHCKKPLSLAKRRTSKVSRRGSMKSTGVNKRSKVLASALTNVSDSSSLNRQPLVTFGSDSTKIFGRDSRAMGNHNKKTLSLAKRRTSKVSRRGSMKSTGVNKRSKVLASALTNASHDSSLNRASVTTSRAIFLPPSFGTDALPYASGIGSISNFLRQSKNRSIKCR